MAGIGALVVGAGIVVAAPASAAAVPDAAALRQAISGLNGTGPAAEIELTPGVTYSLPGSSGCTDEDGNASGDLDILRTEPLKIFTPDGQPPAVLDMTCDAAKTPQRVIEVLGSDGIKKAGKLTLRNVVIRNGHTPDRDQGVHLGGGVLSTGPVVIENSVFENNAAGKGQTGTSKKPEGGVGGFGGAVFSADSVTIDGSAFTGNRGGDGGTGLGDGKLACDGGIGGQGGAVLAVLGLTITNSTFSGNSAGNGGNGADALCTSDQPQAGGNGGDGGSGGAVQCGLVGPVAELPQAIPCGTSMVVKGSTFNANLAGNGGNAGKSGQGRVGGTGGAGGGGGAISYVGLAKAPDGPLTLTVENTTIDGNSSGNGGPGGDGGNAGNGGAGGFGGAVWAQFADRAGAALEVATLTHVTVTENGGGGSGGAPGTPGTLPDGGDQVAAATGTAGSPGETRGGSLAIFDGWKSVSTVVGTSAPTTDGPDCWRAATTVTFSRSTDADLTDPVVGCGFGSGSVLPFAGFALGGLADNGGPTKTRLPAANSTLVDKVTGVTGQLTVDQRGVPRPQSPNADIGAVELQLIDMAVTKTASAASVTAGETVTFTITVKNTGTHSPQPAVVLDDPNCTGMTSAAGDVNTNNTLDPGETFTYTCTATPTEIGTFTNTATATITDGAGVKITRTASVDVSVVEAVGGASPPLANTGTNNPTAELLTGGFLVIGGVVLLYLARPRRVRVRANG